jgi:hypothetical protein
MPQSDTRSLQQIKEETEQTRADLAMTVAQLRSSIVETSQDLRERIRPAALKAEVRTYVRSRGEQLFDDMTDAMRKNPLQAAAVFGSLAYPLFRLARAIPIPIYMIGAGLYLARSETGKAATQKVSDAAADMIDQASQRASAFRDQVSDAAAAVGKTAGDLRDRVSNAAAAVGNTAGDLRDRVSDAAAAVGNTAGDLRDRVSNAAAGVGNTAGDLRDRVSDAAAAVGNTAGSLKKTMVAGANAAASGSGQLRNAAGAAGASLREGSEDLREASEEKKNRISQMAAAAVEKAVGLSENVAAAGQRAGDFVKNSASEATQTAQQAAQTAQQAALSAKQAASDLSERAGRTFVETVEQNALLVAGLGLVIGGVIASALPRTDIEDEFMGETSRSAKRRAQATASRAVREGARRAARQAQAESLDPEGIGEAVRDVGERVRHVAEAAVTTAFEPPEESEQSGVHNNQASRE